MSESPTLPTSSRSTRPDHIGANPSQIIGKVVTHFRKSPTHPSVAIHFADGTCAQIRVDGYDPQYPGIPKALETDSYIQELFASPKAIDLKILDCAFITLSDKAFEKRKRGNTEPLSQTWDHHHQALVFKFANTNESPVKWHCIWASLQERDDTTGDCVFRSYEDVYLELHSRKKSKAKRQSRLR
ncbi:hypothetical protein FA15DRAFT_670243 [Coprinopsis marcescibilis]|uniref:Uncharacterized protein n=1 Tax=Coprinopsis marcescibilis TaxID=230819 RepID=A0A5C3KUX4_COPMA|nr:hypothetical protein FA15DRAFT_670243 [Coprinopsis marcescibilis]